ncbi:MAG TPA: TolC family protein, partial [Burkholderiales bacterium]|nr:TolC family protein [Burkholderiales bacterium]
MKKLLGGPLSVDDAVQIALLNNRGLQSMYAELGIAEADLVQAGRLRNPKFAYLNVHSSSEIKIERALTFDFMQLITMPLATKLERRRFEATQLRVAAEVLQVAVQTRKAYFNAISARQTASYMEDVKVSAEAGAELARRMAGVGNWSKLNQAREQVYYAEATARLARAK